MSWMKCLGDWMVIGMVEKECNLVKKYVVEQKHVDLVKQVKSDYGLKNDSAALRYIIEEYEKNCQKKKENSELIEEFLEAYHQKYYALFDRLRWATQTAEMNSMILLDAINTMLILQDVKDGVLVDSFMSPVLALSKSAYKEKIAHFKQKKDDRKNKRE